jgi:hypothetical protein
MQVKKLIQDLNDKVSNMDEKLSKEIEILKKEKSKKKLERKISTSQIKIHCKASPIRKTISKNALSFLLCLCLFFDKIKGKGRRGSTWK